MSRLEKIFMAILASWTFSECIHVWSAIVRFKVASRTIFKLIQLSRVHRTLSCTTLEFQAQGPPSSWRNDEMKLYRNVLVWTIKFRTFSSLSVFQLIQLKHDFYLCFWIRCIGMVKASKEIKFFFLLLTILRLQLIFIVSFKIIVLFSK